MDRRAVPYQPSAREGRERLVTVGRQPVDEGQARAWLAQLDREAADIAAQLDAAPTVLGDDDWRRRARRALDVKTAEVARLEGWLLRYAPARPGPIVGGRAAGTVSAEDLARWEAAVFEGMTPTTTSPTYIGTQDWQP